ncbi:hypothetical protein [Pedobacter sp. KLB.chiD]|uniref:hypothetical protein n=1 Tax=Pedobacter sp. KLB.chiD TaxID=3387402 RepID=UPI00399C3CCB
MTVTELEDLHDQFLARWPMDKLYGLTVEEYVGLGNKDTFCQWIETKTRMLGSNKGMTSIKFGIYQRDPNSKKPKNYRCDDTYSWQKGYGDNSIEVFDNVKNDIIRIALLAERGRFHEINDIKLPDLFKWKIAFLYSNERLIPIFRREVLLKIAHHFGMSIPSEKRIHEIHEVMILNKPAHLNIYTYMRHLYDQFGRDLKKPSSEERLIKEGNKRKERKAAIVRNTADQLRIGTRSYIAEQRHNKIQQALEKSLAEEFGKENVILEENYVDIKLIQPGYVVLYEVKSAPYASACVRDALGQLLLYSQSGNEVKPKKHIVVGQYPATKNDLQYINFIKENLRLDFDYHHIELT